MEVALPVFTWLQRMGIMQESNIAKKKTNSVVVNSQATNAFQSGHVCYYVCFNFAQMNGSQLTQTLAGVAGEPASPQAAHYNWSVLGDIFATMGMNLSSDHRQLLASGDPKMIVDLVEDLYGRMSGEGPLSQTQRTSVLGSYKPNRDGAVSVDHGLERMKREGSMNPKFDPLQDIERVRQKRAKALQQKEEAEEKKRMEEERAAEIRARIREKMETERKGVDIFSPQEQLSCYREFSNRSVVQFCQSIVENIIQDVESGNAQERLEEKEKTRQRFRKIAKVRKEQDMRLVDTSTVHVHIPRTSDHKLALMCHSLVMDDIVNVAVRPDAMQFIEDRERQRKQDRKKMKNMLSRLKEAERERPTSLKYEQALEVEKQRKKEEERQRDMKFQQMREENERRARKESEELKRVRKEKELEAMMKNEKEKRKQAELALYYAEQKSKVLEVQRKKAMLKEEIEAKKRQEEEAEKEDRRKRGIELNRKLQEQEIQRQESKQSNAPPSLTPYNLGTGHHAAYFGDTLGWQYLTEPEFDMAQIFCQIRADPHSAIPWLEQELSTMQTGKTVYFSEESGKRHPMVLSEGREPIVSAIQFLKRQKSVKAVEDISIGLTLAARQHAMDLVYHGKAFPTAHTGSDGSTLTQRILKYGTPQNRPGTQEFIAAVVRPATLHMSPADMMTLLLMDDAVPLRENRTGLFDRTMVESVGVGHAISTYRNQLAVEVYVVIVSYAFIDKPVAWMSQSHHTGLTSVAEPFLAGDRCVHSAIKRKKDLYVAGNVVLGQTTKAPNYEKLSLETLRKRQYQTAVSEQLTQMTTKSTSPSPKRKSQKRKPDEVPSNDAEEDGTTEIEEKENNGSTMSYKRRLTRFYAKYAPHKVVIVDAALTMYEGREEEMFFTLIRKYGPEPADDEEIDENPRKSTNSYGALISAKEHEDESQRQGTHDKKSGGRNRFDAPTKSSKQKVKSTSSDEHHTIPHYTITPSKKEPKEEDKGKEQQSSGDDMEQQNRTDTSEDNKERTNVEENHDAVEPTTEESAHTDGDEETERTDAESKNEVVDSNVTANENESTEETPKEGTTDGISTQEKSESLLKEEKSEAPQKEEKSEAPLKEEKSEAPLKEEKSEAPVKEEKSESPLKEEKSEAPLKEEKSEAPLKEEKSEAPLKEEKSEAPVKEEKSEAPLKEEKSEAPLKEEESETQPSSTSPLRRKSTLNSSQLDSSNPVKTVDQLAMKTRLERFYTKYNPEKVPHVDRLLVTFQGKEEAMFLTLVRKYGPEPTPEEVPLPGDK